MLKSLTFKRIAKAAMVFAVCYGIYRVAAHNHWIIVTRNAKAVDLGVEPTLANLSSHLSLMVVGDTGKDTGNRTRVVEAMREHANRSSPDAAILLGDNFYESGVTSIDDPRFATDFENLFDATSFPFPFYLCLGNHDYGGDVDAQVEYTNRSTRWKMPQRYFQTRMIAGTDTVDVFVLDTIAIDKHAPGAASQMKWFDEGLAASDARWKIVAGHHPAITGGRHEVSQEIAALLPPLFEKHGVDIYLSGHDHDLQLSDSQRGWLQVVSGAGSKLRSTNWNDHTVFAKAAPGFCWILIGDGELSISFYSVNARLYTHTTMKNFAETINVPATVLSERDHDSVLN